MTYVDQLKDQLNNANTGTPVVAAIYARVSTRNEGQKDSCSNQIKSATEFLEAFPNVSLSENHIFTDDGVSGKSVVGRVAYQKLMSEIRAGQIKLLVAKTCSRLFRSVAESQDFLTTLLKNQVTLFTLEDNRFWDFNLHPDELMFTLNSVFAAGTSRTQSDAGHAAQNRRIKDKKLFPKDLVTGFKWDSEKKEIVPDPEYAPIITTIFEEYVYRNSTPASICKLLKEKGIKFPKRKRDPETREPYIIYESLCEKTISKIIANPKYIGRFTINTRSSTYIPGEEAKRFATKPKEHVVVDRPDLQIVDPDLFEMAQRIRQSRINIYEKPDKKTTQARFQGQHKYAAKIFCPICNKPYHFGYADRAGTIPIYRIKNHADCPNPIRRIGERELEEITKKALKQTLDQQKEVCSSLEQILRETVEASQNNNDEISNFKKQKASRENQRDNLIDQLSEGGFTNAARDRIKQKINQITEEIVELSKTIASKDNYRLDDTYVSEKMSAIHAAIADLRNFTTIDRERILNYVDRIDLPPNGDIEIFLKSGQIIVATEKNKMDFSGQKIVGKKRSQDVLCSSPAAYPGSPDRGPHRQ